MSPELELVKAALLYGDVVTVLSPVTTMLLRLSDLAQSDLLEQIGLVRRVAPFLTSPEDAEKFNDAADERMMASLRKGRGRLTREDVILRGLVAQQLTPHSAELAGVAEGFLERAGFNQLAQARAKGMVQFDSCDPGDGLDLMASCIIMAKLAETGQKADDSGMDAVLSVFLGKLSNYLSTGRDYLLFDEPLASLMESAVAGGLVQPKSGPTARSAQVVGASGFMARLPTFPDATVDEVLDIRAELASSLNRFRAVMVSTSRALSTKPWDSTFSDELHDAWIETVQPAIADIESAVQDNRSILHRASSATDAAKDALPGLAILAAGMAGHVPAVSMVGGALSVASPALQAAWHHQVEQREIQARPFYFLYQLGRLL